MATAAAAAATPMTAAASLAAVTQAMKNLDLIRQQVDATQTLLQQCILGANHASFTSLPPLRSMSPPSMEKANSGSMTLLDVVGADAQVPPYDPTIAQDEPKDEEQTETPNHHNTTTTAAAVTNPSFVLQKDNPVVHRGSVTGSRSAGMLSRDFSKNNQSSCGDLSRDFSPGDLSTRSPIPIKGIVVQNDEEHSVTSILMHNSTTFSIDDDEQQEDDTATRPATNLLGDDTEEYEDEDDLTHTGRSSSPVPPQRRNSLTHELHKSLSNLPEEPYKRQSSLSPSAERKLIKCNSGPNLDRISTPKNRSNSMDNSMNERMNRMSPNAAFGASPNTTKSTEKDKRRGKLKKSRSIRRFFGAVGKDKAASSSASHNMEDASGRSSRSLKRNFSANEGKSSSRGHSRGRLGRWNSSDPLRDRPKMHDR